MRFATLLLVFAACKPFKAAPGEAPAEVCVAANEGKTVSVAGYLVLPVITLDCAESCDLYVSPAEGETSRVAATFPAGFEANHVRPIEGKGNLMGAGAETVRDYQIVIRPESGTDTLGIGDTVRVTGTLTTSNDTGSLFCRIAVARVEPAK